MLTQSGNGVPLSPLLRRVCVALIRPLAGHLPGLRPIRKGDRERPFDPLYHPRLRKRPNGIWGSWRLLS